MSQQRLFSVSKVGLFLDTFHPSQEKRKGIKDPVKVLVCSFRAAPFDAKLATAIDTGIGDDSNVRTMLFKLNHPDPKPHVDRVNFTFDVPRQNMVIFASSDTDDSRIGLLQVRITGIYARTQKDRAGYEFCFTGTFGPVGRDELEYVNDWCRSQRCVTFEESEPLIEVEETPSDADEKARENVVTAPAQAPMWGDGDEKNPNDSATGGDGAVRQRLHSHAGGKKKTAKATHDRGRAAKKGRK